MPRNQLARVGLHRYPQPTFTGDFAFRSMHLASLLAPDRIIPAMRACRHMDAIEELVDQLVLSGALAADLRAEILGQLVAREEFISTGIGGGVAIPHAFSEHVSEVTAVLGRSPGGIDFEALDQAPVFLVILFLVPKKDYQSHLRMLAAIAKMFANTTIRQHIDEASTPDEILTALRIRPQRRQPSSTDTPASS
jgi:mannitol/fructose-specific phosphotransferase system IIA component (Ntr-type)